MEISELTIRLLVLLLPGILSTIVFQMFSTKGRLSNREYFVYVIVFGFISYLALFVVALHIDFIECTFFEAFINTNVAIDFIQVLFASIIGIIIGLVAVKMSNKNTLFNKCIIKRITTNTGNVDVWSEVFENSNEGTKYYAIVYDKEKDVTYKGWIKNYSVSKDRRELLLEDAKKYKGKKRNKHLETLDRVYFQINSENIVIELEKK